MIQQFKKKPVIVNAVKYDGLNYEEVERFVGRELKKDIHDAAYEAGAGAPQMVLLIETKDGIMAASPGDYVIQEPYPTGDRDFYPCKPDILKQTYEEVLS